MTCIAIKGDGTRCTNPKKYGNFCGVHKDHEAKQKKKEEEEKDKKDRQRARSYGNSLAKADKSERHKNSIHHYIGF